MGIPLTTNFTVNAGLPLDDRWVVADLTARDAIDPLKRYPGLAVYVLSEEQKFELKGGLTNDKWVEAGSGSGGGGSRLNLMEDGSFEGAAPFGWNISGAGNITAETDDVMTTPTNVQAMKADLAADNQIHQIWETPPAMDGVRGKLEFWHKNDKELIVSVWSNGSLIGVDLLEITSTYKKFSLPFDFVADNVEVFIDNDEAATYFIDEMFIGPSTDTEFTDDQKAAMPNGKVESGVVSDYTLDADAPDFITVDTSGNDVTINLPDPAGFRRTITIIKIAADNTLIIDGNGALVNGASSKEIWDVNNSVTLRSDDTNWWIT